MIFTLYNPQTGELAGKTVDCHPDHVKHYTPKGLAAIPGKHDHYCRRVDLETLAVVPHQPPQPSINHEWDAATERWKLSPVAQTARDADRAARMTILNIEKSSDRAIREALLELLPGDSPARLRVKAADDAIASQRQKLKKV